MQFYSLRLVSGYSTFWTISGEDGVNSRSFGGVSKTDYAKKVTIEKSKQFEDDPDDSK